MHRFFHAACSFWFLKFSRAVSFTGMGRCLNLSCWGDSLSSWLGGKQARSCWQEKMGWWAWISSIQGSKCWAPLACSKPPVMRTSASGILLLSLSLSMAWRSISSSSTIWRLKHWISGLEGRCWFLKRLLQLSIWVYIFYWGKEIRNLVKLCCLLMEMNLNFSVHSQGDRKHDNELGAQRWGTRKISGEFQNHLLLICILAIQDSWNSFSQWYQGMNSLYFNGNSASKAKYRQNMKALWHTISSDQARDRMYAMLDSVIHRRRCGKDFRQDFLESLIMKHSKAGMDKEADGNKLTDNQLKDNILTLLVAGHDTTTAALTWLIKFLEENPAVLECLRVRLLVQQLSDSCVVDWIGNDDGFAGGA